MARDVYLMDELFPPFFHFFFFSDRPHYDSSLYVSTTFYQFLQKIIFWWGLTMLSGVRCCQAPAKILYFLFRTAAYFCCCCFATQVHEAVIAAGRSKSGCTVHQVTEEVDAGPIVVQEEVEVASDDTPESLKAKVGLRSMELEGYHR